MIELIHINKSFRGNEVLKKLELTINKGDLIYIHGINGCGKSTLFKIIADIIEPDSGKVIKNDGLKIGGLIENPGFLETESIKTNYKFLSSLTNSYDETKIRELCKYFNLNYDNKKSMKSYSVGMRQKAGIIQSIMEGQNLVLLDEPTRGIDKEGIKAFANLINKLSSEGLSIVIASHDYLENIHFNKKYELDDGVLIAE